MIKIVVMLVCLFSSSAKALESIMFFHDSSEQAKKALLDYQQLFPTKDIKFESYNVQSSRDLEFKLNQIVDSAVKKRRDYKTRNFNLQKAYQEEFMRLINNEKVWRPLYDQLGIASITQGKALQLQIQKIPAFVFDGKKIVYGITSLKEAVKIYKTWRKNND